MAAYYNEIDPYAAQWLRNLIAAGHIAPGDVDERSIVDVRADDIREYTQCHFFAGIGGWSYALRLALWEDDRPVWTGSCPCQPFSTAGKGKKQSDERHLWPHWSGLISECRPPVIFGEQVASAVAAGWFDDVSSDMEAQGYAIAAAVLPACAVNAPHKRDRLWFVAQSTSGNDRGSAGTLCKADGGSELNMLPQPGSAGEIPAVLANAGSAGLPLWDENGNREITGPEFESRGESERDSSARDRNFWETESGLGFVADGVPARMGSIKALGNAIVPQVAAEFIKAAM